MLSRIIPLLLPRIELMFSFLTFRMSKYIRLKIKPFKLFNNIFRFLFSCKKGMYGGINLPSDYVWPEDLVMPPKQISTTPLNPTPTPTGSMTIQAESAEETQGKSSAASYDFKAGY